MLSSSPAESRRTEVLVNPPRLTEDVPPERTLRKPPRRSPGPGLRKVSLPRSCGCIDSLSLPPFLQSPPSLVWHCFLNWTFGVTRRSNRLLKKKPWGPLLRRSPPLMENLVSFPSIPAMKSSCRFEFLNQPSFYGQASRSRIHGPRRQLDEELTPTSSPLHSRLFFLFPISGAGHSRRP